MAKTSNQPDIPAELRPKPLTRDRERRAVVAARKKASGQKLNKIEQRDLDAYLRHQDELAALRHYAAVPRAVWDKAAGRGRQVMLEQGKRYKAPILGPTINLFEFVRWFHDRIAENRYSDDKLAPPDGAGGAGASEYRNPRDQLAAAKARLAEAQLARVQKELVRADEVRRVLRGLMASIRANGKQLEQRYGAAGRKLHEDLIHAVRSEIDGLFDQLSDPD